MAVRLPILISEIELDAPARNPAVINPDGSVGKIRTGFAVPGAELHDLDLLARRAGERSSKVSREPAGLQFQLIEAARQREKRALANFGRGEKLGVTVGAGHPGRLPFLGARREARLLASGAAGG